LDVCSTDPLKIDTYNKHFRNLEHSYAVITYNRKMSYYKRRFCNAHSVMHIFHIVLHTAEVSLQYFPYNFYNAFK
jgi:Zn-dependent peptidase ImmA (M78 family)